VPPNRLQVNQFGIDTKFWLPGQSQIGDYILAVGNDMRRDYSLLTQLAKRMERRFIVVTRQNLGEIPSNVQQIQGNWHEQTLSDEGLRQLYQDAIMVVTPLQESVQPSGQSVCLQAMACGKPVVLTKTTGLWSEEMMRDGENVSLVAPGDIESLHRAVSVLLTDQEYCQKLGETARRTVCDEADISLFASRLENLATQIAR
jgi:glycosyltransferase involved in cell wall biosynthesis